MHTFTYGSVNIFECANVAIENKFIDEEDTIFEKVTGCCIQDKDIINRIIVSAESDEQSKIIALIKHNNVDIVRDVEYNEINC